MSLQKPLYSSNAFCDYIPALKALFPQFVTDFANENTYDFT